jgi:hypothetical protein
MVYIGQQDHLTVLWTSARGLPRMDAMKAFRDVILLRENVELKWLFGSLDSMDILPESSEDFFSAAAAFGATSTSACLKRLLPWSPALEAGLPSLSSIPLPNQLPNTQDLQLGPGFNSVEQLQQDEVDMHLGEASQDNVTDEVLDVIAKVVTSLAE